MSPFLSSSHAFLQKDFKQNNEVQFLRQDTNQLAEQS